MPRQPLHICGAQMQFVHLKEARACKANGACHEGEDAEVDDDGEQKHADGAGYALQQGSLQCIIKKQLS